LLDRVVDVYLPDLKYADSADGYTYSKVPDYAAHARAALKEMYRQTGDELVFDEDGLLRRGLVVRLLVLPNDIAGVRESLEWIRDCLSPRVAVSLMAQYYATNKAATDPRYTLLSRRIAEVYDEQHGYLDDSGVELLAELARGGRALELGIGTGRVALPLSARGVEVHGIDASPAMIERLRAKPGGAGVEVTVGDFADVSAEGEFSLVYVVFNTFFVLLTQGEQVRCFGNVAARL